MRITDVKPMHCKAVMNGVRHTKPVRAVDDIKFLTVDEQEKFLETANRSYLPNPQKLLRRKKTVGKNLKRSHEF